MMVLKKKSQLVTGVAWTEKFYSHVKDEVAGTVEKTQGPLKKGRKNSVFM